MLMLTRKFGTTVVIGDEIRVTFDKGRGNQIKLVIEAPKDVAVRRSEILGKPK